MALVTFDILGFVKAWGAIKDLADEAAHDAFRATLKDALENQKEFGYKNRTGQLTRSMRWKTWHRGEFNYSGELLTTAPYALWVDSGTRPHKIRARRAPFLRFYWPKVGAWVQFKQVNHPGFKGAGFSAAAIQTFGQGAPLALERAIARAANK